MKNPMLAAIRKYAAGLRLPWLTALVFLVFVADLVIPDIVPFADEILLGLLGLMLARLRTRREPPPEDDPAAG